MYVFYYYYYYYYYFFFHRSAKLGCGKSKVDSPVHSSASSGNSATKMAGQNLSVPQFPAGTSPQRLSATPSTDRKKVVLKPGHSLMDWIRLGRSGQDLTSVGGEVQEVSQEELAKHNKPNDAWIALRGTCWLAL